MSRKEDKRVRSPTGLNFCVKKTVSIKIDYAKKHFGENIFEMALVNFVDENYKGLIVSLNDTLTERSKLKIPKIISDLKSLSNFMCLPDLDIEIRKFESFTLGKDVDWDGLNKFTINIYAYLDALYEESKKIYPEIIKKMETEKENTRIETEEDLVSPRNEINKSDNSKYFFKINILN